MENKSFIKNLVSDFANASSDTIAFSLYDGETIKNISYPQFADDILRAAGYFKDRNITGQHIALIAPNSYEWFVTFFALLITNNIAVPLNYDLPVEMLTHYCCKADILLILTDSDYLTKAQNISSDKMCLTHQDLSSTGHFGLKDIRCAGPLDTMLLLPTSGTNSVSKLVEIASGNLQHSVENAQVSFLVPGSERLLFTLPNYHIFGLMGAITTFQYRKTLCIGRGIRYVFQDLPILKPTCMSLMPSMVDSFCKILKRPKSGVGPTASTHFSVKRITVGGAIGNPENYQYILSQGIQIATGYGMTESTGDGTWFFLDPDHIRTIGKLRDGIECRISNNEIFLKGPSIMKGYYKDPEETAKVIVDGWLHTGDMGYCDEDGYYYITGRKKNVIILSNGENVNPEEIEATFGECEAIEECLVFSDGKGICADVFAKDQVVASAFIKAYNESMPLYRQVYKVNYTAEPLPKTGSGKIKRKENL